MTPDGRVLVSEKFLQLEQPPSNTFEAKLVLKPKDAEEKPEE